jgi:hypothetical protein
MKMSASLFRHKYSQQHCCQNKRQDHQSCYENTAKIVHDNIETVVCILLNTYHPRPPSRGVIVCVNRLSCTGKTCAQKMSGVIGVKPSPPRLHHTLAHIIQVQCVFGSP